MSPIYDFECPFCKSIKEDVFKSINSSIAEICPECYSNMEQLVGKSSFVLKGNGWEKDGYSSK